MADISITGKSGDTLLDVKASAWTSGEVELGSCYGIDVVYCGALLGFEGCQNNARVAYIELL